jgi:ribosomal protein L32
MEIAMDNKYGLGSAKVAHAHHESKLKSSHLPARACSNCGHDRLILCPTMNDHYCEKCGQYQNDVPMDYSSGHSADY